MKTNIILTILTVTNLFSFNCMAIEKLTTAQLLEIDPTNEEVKVIDGKIAKKIFKQGLVKRKSAKEITKSFDYVIGQNPGMAGSTSIAVSQSSLMLDGKEQSTICHEQATVQNNRSGLRMKNIKKDYLCYIKMS